MAQTQKKQGDMGTGSVKKLLLQLMIPAVVAQIVNLLYNIVDRIYIGHIPGIGAAALTGVGLFTPILMLLNAFAMLIGAGGAPRTAIAMGQGDKDQAEKIVSNSFTMLLIFSVLLTIVFYAAAPALLRMFGASDATLPYALAYSRIYILGSVCVLIVLGMNPFITAQGFAKISMLSVLIGAIANIILDPIFIFGLGLGVKGAALATIFSQAMSCIWVLHFLTGKTTFLKIRKRNFRLQASIILPCLALGLSMFIMQASESVISVCFNSSLLKYGGDIAVGAMTILTSAMQFAMLPLQGLGQGAQPILSYNFGAKNMDRVRATFKLLLKVSLAYSTVMWALVMLFPGAFASIFTNETELLSFTAHALRIYLACILLFGIQIACQMTFTSIGCAKASIMVAVMRKFVLLLPLIFILPHVFTKDPTSAVYMAEPVADFFAVTFTCILFRSEFKKALKTLE